MRNCSFCWLALLIATISVGCKNDNDTLAEPNFLTCKVGSESFSADDPSWTIILGKTAILGFSGSGEQSVKLVLPKDLNLQAYEIGQSDSVGGTFQLSPSLLMYADSGNIEITNIDKANGLIEGNFDFRASSIPVNGIVFQSNLTDGSFKTS